MIKHKPHIEIIQFQIPENPVSIDTAGRSGHLHTGPTPNQPGLVEAYTGVDLPHKR